MLADFRKGAAILFFVSIIVFSNDFAGATARADRTAPAAAEVDAFEDGAAAAAAAAAFHDGDDADTMETSADREDAVGTRVPRSPPPGEGRRRSRGRHGGRSRLRSHARGHHHHQRREESRGIDAAEDATSSAPSPSRNCSWNCQSREDVKRFRLEAIKAQILRKLRMARAPNITKADRPKLPPILETLVDQYDAMAPAVLGGGAGGGGGGPQDDFHATTTKVIKFGDRPPPDKAVNTDANNVIYFGFQPQTLRARVLQAQLYVYLERPVTAASGSTLLLVYKLPPARQSHRQPELICTVPVELDSGRQWRHWRGCDIETTVQSWLFRDEENNGLKIEINDHRGNALSVLHPQDKNDERRPFLEIRTKPRSENRRKRMIGIDCEEDDEDEEGQRTEETRCCRYKLTVDFDSFGWDWIVAPKRYEAYYCKGECPFAFLQRYTHSHIIQQANPYGVGGPCCTPTKMSPVSLLYFDDRREIISGILPDMSVDRCGCS